MTAAVARTAAGTDQANTLRPQPLFDIEGRLYYKRVWDYNTSKDTEKFKEYLPGAKIELHIEKKGQTKIEKWKDGVLTEAGEFWFAEVPACTRIGLKIFLDHKAGVTQIKGNENLVDRDDFQLKKGRIVWRRVDLDIKKITDANSTKVDFGDIEIQPTTDTDANIASLCDTYKTIWRGFHWIKEKTDHELGPCPVNYPVRTISYESGKQLYLLPGDVRDADVILHEYGHFIGEEMLGGLTHPGYQYNDDMHGTHGPNTEEHYESAWNEGHATFLSSAISDDEIYRDGYDSNLTMNLKTDNIKIGPHCEGSIQCALWELHKNQAVDFKKGFWTAFCHKKRKADTIFAFYDNWKDENCPDIDKLKAALKKFNLHMGYKYVTRLVFSGKPLDPANPTGFSGLDELYDAYGKTAGGTLAKYKEEFYNRNRYVQGGAFGPKAKVSAFTLVKNNTYIVPERFEIT
jgi:hypothetical protein